MPTDSNDVVAGTNATATQYNNLRKDHVLGLNNNGVESDSATISIDWSDKTKGHEREVTLGGNRILAFSNVTVRQRMIIHLIQDGTGSRTITWPSGISWPFNVTPTLTTTANRVDSFGLICTGSGSYRGYILGQGLPA